MTNRVISAVEYHDNSIAWTAYNAAQDQLKSYNSSSVCRTIEIIHATRNGAALKHNEHSCILLQ